MLRTHQTGDVGLPIHKSSSHRGPLELFACSTVQRVCLKPMDGECPLPRGQEGSSVGEALDEPGAEASGHDSEQSL